MYLYAVPYITCLFMQTGNTINIFFVSIKVLSELEDEKRKHAQDTAQGDDVTYMLEKERGRLKQEVKHTIYCI